MSPRPGKVLKPHKTAQGYLRVEVTRMEPDGTVLMAKRYVHRLVALHFLDTDPKETVNHRDYCKANNHWENLEWMTRLENAEHALAKHSC